MLTKPNCVEFFVVLVPFVFIVCSAVGPFDNDTGELWA